MEESDHIKIKAGNFTYKTSKQLLKAQSKYFQALVSLPDSSDIDLTNENKYQAWPYDEILSLVALPPGTPIEYVLAYVIPDSWFDKPDRFPTIWILLHNWGLEILTERFKDELHRRIFESKNIITDCIIQMEKAISPCPDEYFFRQCAGICLARRLYRTEFPYKYGGWDVEDETWDETRSAVWMKYGDELRKMAMVAKNDVRKSALYWRERFSLKRFRPDSITSAHDEFD